MSRPLFLDHAIDLKEQRTARGTARLWAISPTVYVTSVSGHLEEAHADLFEAYGAERIRQAEGRSLFVFHDWLEMTGYESECRKRLTSWSVARRKSYAEVHLATKSKLVVMGVGVANIALGGLIRTHPTRDLLERELGRVVERAREAPRK